MSDASTAPLLGEDAPAKPSLLGTEALRVPGTRHAGRHRARVRHGPAGACAARLLDDPRIRTLSLVIISRATEPGIAPNALLNARGSLFVLKYINYATSTIPRYTTNGYPHS